MRKRTRPAASTLLARLSPCSRWAVKVGYSDRVRERGGQIVGLWPTEGYEFTHSDAVVDEGYFAGLAIDEVNQPQLTEERVAAWCAFIADQYSSKFQPSNSSMLQ